MPGVKRRRSRSGRPAKRRMTKQFMQNYAKKVRAKKSFATRVKRTVLKMSETKYKNLDITANTNAFDGDGDLQSGQSRVFNNGGTEFRIWDNQTTSTNGIWPSQGDTDANREGDRIMCIGMKIRGKLTFLPQYRNSLVKAWYVPYNDLQVSGSGRAGQDRIKFKTVPKGQCVTEGDGAEGGPSVELCPGIPVSRFPRSNDFSQGCCP